jgi:uncharacterized phiE125 gp8 family phage protein
MIINQPLPKKANRNFIRILDASIEPVTATEVKDFARIDGSNEDATIELFITAARQAAEDFLGRAFIEQTWRLSFDWWEDYAIELPRPPLISISSVTMIDDEGVITVYDSANYYIATEGMAGRCVIKDGCVPPINADRFITGYRINYVAGYGSDGTYVPEVMKLAIKQWAVAIYEGRAMTGDPPPDVYSLLKQYRTIRY